VLIRKLHAERVRRRAALLVALSSRRYFALLVALETFTRARKKPISDAGTPLPEVAQAQLERALHAVRKRGRKLAARAHSVDAEELHALRIRAKRLRYLLEFLNELTGKPGQRLVTRLTRLQDVLGEHQDAIVAVQSISGIAPALRGGAMPLTRAPSAEARSDRATTQRGADALIRTQQRRAALARAKFRAAWRDFASDATRRDLRKLQRRLRAASKARGVQRTPGASS
jgi:CHAD domain-containing protein